MVYFSTFLFLFWFTSVFLLIHPSPFGTGKDQTDLYCLTHCLSLSLSFFLSHSYFVSVFLCICNLINIDRLSAYYLPIYLPTYLPIYLPFYLFFEHKTKIRTRALYPFERPKEEDTHLSYSTSFYFFLVRCLYQKGKFMKICRY